MAATDILDQIGKSLSSTATVKSVFGEPIQMEGKIVIPIAKVAYGLGGGFGHGHGFQHNQTKGVGEGEGGGGGGGVRAFPAGALEITEDATRFIAFPDVRAITAAFAAGALFAGVILGRRSRR